MFNDAFADLHTDKKIGVSQQRTFPAKAEQGDTVILIQLIL